MKREILPYNPGLLPTKDAPKAGQIVEFEVDGLPPIKKDGLSCRNPQNPRYDTFIKLREAATTAMNGRAWYFGSVRLNVTIYSRKQDVFDATINEYIGGIEDTLDGSSGVHFTYLPIVFEDDCQVFQIESRFEESDYNHYRIRIGFH